MIRQLAIGLLATALPAAEGGLVVTLHGLARESNLLRVEIHADRPGHAQGRLTCEVRAEGADGPVLAATSAEVADTARLATGAILVLTLPSPCPARLRVTTTLSSPGREAVIATVEARTPAAALADVAAATRVLREHGEPDPLPWLWAEQASDLANGRATAAAVEAMTTLTRRLSDWSAGLRPAACPGVNVWALRDPVDGSVQPYRLILPPGTGPFPVALLLGASPPGLTKARWDAPSPQLVAAASAAGVAVLDCYPAGDRAWNGAAARRLPVVLADAATRAPLALDLTRCARITTATTPAASLDDPAWWRALATTAAPVTHPGPSSLAAVLTAPFTVVVGTREHRAARDANRRLAAAFHDAYAAHAHAVPPEVDDDVDATTLAGRNLVLIGNPRSNRVLAGLALSLPYTWDHRTVRDADGVSTLRASGPSVACLSRLADGRLVLVLDGTAPAWGDGLPLAGQASPSR